tara:strand:+ start:109 stop:852 length:744 start_codon:yes stop_codon:yes gene_type:complete
MSNIDLIGSSLIISFGIAFFGGFLSFVSPCVLPIVPPYIIYLAGSSSKDKKIQTYKMFYTSIFFVLGLSTVFIFLGLAFSKLGSIFIKFQNEMGYISGIIVIIFGIHFLGLIKFSILEKEVRFNINKFSNSILSPYILGLAFAFGWTPCIGPILGAILSISAQETNSLRGGILMLSYALGLGLPFILIATFFEKSKKTLNIIKNKSFLISKITGSFLILIGVLLISGGFQSFSFWIIEIFPFLINFG